MFEEKKPASRLSISRFFFYFWQQGWQVIPLATAPDCFFGCWFSFIVLCEGRDKKTNRGYGYFKLITQINSGVNISSKHPRNKKCTFHRGLQWNMIGQYWAELLAMHGYAWKIDRYIGNKRNQLFSPCHQFYLLTWVLSLCYRQRLRTTASI